MTDQLSAVMGGMSGVLSRIASIQSQFTPVDKAQRIYRKCGA